MKNKFIDKIIADVVKRKSKICYMDEMRAIIERHLQDEFSDQKAYKILYYLKRRGYLFSLKKNIYYISLPDEEISEYEIIETRYRDILHQHCISACGHKRKRYIGWQKALEIHMLDYSVPEHILIVNKERQAQETVLQWKTVLFKTYTSKDTSLFSRFFPHCSNIKLWKYVLPVANFELALLETLYNIDPVTERLLFAQLKKYLKKIKRLDFSPMQAALQVWKHHTSCNRLYHILLQLHPKLADELHQHIKQWGFFIDVDT